MNNIREEREKAGMTLSRLAAKTSIPISTLSRYQDSEDVPVSALRKIAEALDLPMSALLVARETPEDGRLSYDQLTMQLQAFQQHAIYAAMRFDSLRRRHRLLCMIAGILGIFLLYIFVDRFGFPNDGIFHAG